MQFIRIVLYQNHIVSFIRNKFISSFIPGVCGLYFLCLDIWGGDWNIIKNYKTYHEIAFSYMMLLSFIVLFFRATSDYFNEKSDKKQLTISDQFAIITTRLVTEKLNRFKESARRITHTGDTFRLITKPKIQINIILGEINNLLKVAFGVKNSQVCITIMHKDPINGKWHYKFDTNSSWNHTKASALIEGKSTAAEAIRRGEPIFHACKLEAENNGLYLMSERDKRNGEGSVFCYPVKITNKDYSDEYVISIVTYGKRLCKPHDDALENAINDLFTDLCRRIELELTLLSIYFWRFEYVAPKGQGAA